MVESVDVVVVFRDVTTSNPLGDVQNFRQNGNIFPNKKKTELVFGTMSIRIEIRLKLHQLLVEKKKLNSSDF